MSKPRFQPVLREGAKIDLASAAQNSVMMVLENKYQFPYRTCLMCDYFQETLEQCQLFKARPPARVIAFGCEKFEDKDLIPF